MLLEQNKKLVFIGDSITDAGRFQDSDGLGSGYVRLIRDLLLVRHAALEITVVNRGVSGDTVRHLERRWQSDVLDQHPDYLSISIGVNDVWRQLQEPRNPEEVLIEEFEETYRRLLDQTRTKVQSTLFLCDPTVIGEDLHSPHNRLMSPYLECVSRLVRDYEAVHVPMFAAFRDAISSGGAQPWTSDGVHPLSNGHMLMALTFLDTVEGKSRGAQ